MSIDKILTDKKLNVTEEEIVYFAIKYIQTELVRHERAIHDAGTFYENHNVMKHLKKTYKELQVKLLDLENVQDELKAGDLNDSE